MAAEKVLIQGESGTGKTFSMKDLNPDTTAIVSPEKTRLPFRNQFKMLVGKTDADDIIRFIDVCVKEGRKSIVIDDFQYILAIPYMHRIKESGWDKYNDFGGNYFNIIDHCKTLPDDVIVYFMTHTETLDDGVTRTKLIGKLLREKITIEGLFTIVLKTIVAEGKYYFATQNSGKDTVKTPFGMFDSYAIDNNLKYVDEKIRNYYYMEGAKSDDEMKQADSEVSAPEIEKPSEGRRRRGSSSPVAENPTPEEPPKRQRRSRSLPADMVNIPEGTDEEVPFAEGLDHDAYFKTADGNYIMKHKGDDVPEGAEEISKEEFVKGGSEIASGESEAPKRRTRRTRN